MKRPRARQTGPASGGDGVDVTIDALTHTETSPRLTGGDLDADWHGAYASGDEAVGGSTATPDQDVVDELGEALGVAQPSDAEIVTSGEILRARDRHRWHLERDAVLQEAQLEEAEAEEAWP